MTKQVFLIGTEHQMYQVECAIKHFELDIKNSVIIIEKTHQNHDFIFKIKKETAFETIITFDTWTFKDLIFSKSKSKQFIALCKKFVNQEIVFFASHYSTDTTLLFNTIVKPVQMYLMDEGNASFLVKAKRKNNNSVENFKYLVKSFFYKKLIQLPKSLIYFTQFDFELPKKDKAIVYKTPKNQNPLQHFVSAELSFIGSSIVDLGMISQEKYLLFLQKIIQQHQPEIEIFKYYPHRKEAQKKLDLISNLGFEIVTIDLPFEAFFSQQVSASAILCSFYTTGVVFNIERTNQVLPKLKIYKFQSNLLKIHKKIYDDIYMTFKKNKNIIFETI